MAQDEKLVDLLKQLYLAERALMRSHGVRIRVDKVTADGRNALCSAAQVKGRFLRADHPVEEVVTACHVALAPLYRIGVNPLIGVLSRSPKNTFKTSDANDPFQLRLALHAVGVEEMLLPGYVLPPMAHTFDRPVWEGEKGPIE